MACSCNPATWRLVSEDGLRSGVLLSGVPCRSGVRAKLGINMGILKEFEISRLSQEGRTGPGGKPSRQKSPCRAVVGSHPWMGVRWQPDRYSRTWRLLFGFILKSSFIYGNNFFLKLSISLFSIRDNNFLRSPSSMRYFSKTHTGIKFRNWRTFHFDNLPILKALCSVR